MLVHSAHRPPGTRLRSRGVLPWLLSIWALVAFAGASGLAEASVHTHAHSAPHPTQAMPVVQGISDHEFEEIEEHGHHHSDNVLQDLLTLGHTHAGCSGVGLPTDAFVWLGSPLIDVVVPLQAIEAVQDRFLSNPFRPPIA